MVHHIAFNSHSTSFRSATVSLFFTIVATDVGSSLFLVPHLFAIIVSSWMNFVIFWNRLEGKRRDAALEILRGHSEAAWKSFSGLISTVKYEQNDIK
jgi:hypothetical protein